MVTLYIKLILLFKNVRVGGLLESRILGAVIEVKHYSVLFQFILVYSMPIQECNDIAYGTYHGIRASFENQYTGR